MKTFIIACFLVCAFVVTGYSQEASENVSAKSENTEVITGLSESEAHTAKEGAKCVKGKSACCKDKAKAGACCKDKKAACTDKKKKRKKKKKAV